MKRFLFYIAICLLLLIATTLLFGIKLARADGGDTIILIGVVPTPTPFQPTPPPATPKPTPQPELPSYQYDAADMRCLSRAIWSITPKNPTRETKLALCEVVQNRVDDDSGDYRDTVRDVLLQRGEFLDYDADAYRSEENDAIADYAMRSWIAAKIGNRSYRLTPSSGVMCAFYDRGGYDYIIVYDRNGNALYDSGAKK